MSSTAAHPTPSARATPAPATGGVPLRALLIGVALATVGGALALGDPERAEIGLLLGLTLGSALLILNGAAWALAPILIGELTIASYFIAQFGMSLRLAATLLAVVGAATVVLRSSTLADPRFRRVFLPALALVAVATAGNLLFSGSEYTIKYLRYQAVQLLALLVAAAVIGRRRDLLRLGAIILPIALLGAFVAVWQHYARGSALGADLVSIWKGRSVGLTGSPVLLANQLAFALVPVLGLLAVGPWRRDRPRLALCAVAGLLALGLYFTYTRSALLALGPGILAIGLCLGGTRRKIIVGAVVGAFLAFQLLAGTGLIGARYYKTAENDTSAASHESLLSVSLAIVLDNPLTGVGHEHFEAISLGYLDEVPVSSGEGAIGTERPHNDFLTVWLSWGIFALVAYLALFLGALRNFRLAAASDDLLIRGLAIGCIGGLAAYAVNSSFHNYLDSSALLFLYAGGSVALARLSGDGRLKTEDGSGPGEGR